VTRRIAALIAAVVVTAPALAGCRNRDARPERAVVEIVADGTAHDYSFDVPERIEAGPTRFSLVNRGDEPHHAQLFRLNPGSTVDDLSEALATADPLAALEHGSFAGGTALVTPASTSEADAVVPLAAGEYVLLCFVPGPDGTPHLAHGMLQPFQVQDTDLGTSEPPDADAAVSLTDYAIDAPDTVASGSVLTVTNDATREHHEMIVARLDAGDTFADVIDAVTAGTPPPITPVGGIQALAPAGTQALQLRAEPGRYVLVCEIPSPDGTPHHAKGMLRELTAT
jgi:hypothetical protein